MQHISKTLTYLTITALCACLLSSCSKHHKVLVEDQIVLGAYSVGTKAIVSGKQSLIDQCGANGGFGVYGYKLYGNESYRLFNNVKVKPTSSSENTSWTYSPTRYWDSNPLAIYQFVAYWPWVPDAAPGAGDNYVTYVTEESSVLTIHDIPNWQDSISANDFMTDAARGRYRGQEDIFNSGTVTFTFRHLLAKVVFRAYYTGVETKVIKIHGLNLKPSDAQHMPMADGTINCTRTFGGQTGAEITLSTPTAANSMDFSKTLLNNAEGVSLQGAFYSGTGAAPAENTKHVCSWLTAPSANWDKLNVDVTYSVDGVQTTGTAHNLTLGETLSGYQYVVTLKITAASGIELESVQVKKWMDGGVFNPFVYNW